jgi:hypothetical protein
MSVNTVAGFQVLYMMRISSRLGEEGHGGLLMAIMTKRLWLLGLGRQLFRAPILEFARQWMVCG